MMVHSQKTYDRITELCDCLSRSRRRYTLRHLKEVAEPLALADLAEDVADWEAETPKSEIPAETVKNVYMALYHTHIPKLADADFVQYDQECDVVELSEYPEELGEKGQFLTGE